MANLLTELNRPPTLFLYKYRRLETLCWHLAYSLDSPTSMRPHSNFGERKNNSPRLFKIRIALPLIYALLFFILPSSSSRALAMPPIRSGKRVLMSFPWQAFHRLCRVFACPMQKPCNLHLFELGRQHACFSPNPHDPCDGS